MPEPSQETEARSRQDQILMLASEGLTDKEIAAKLKLSPETVGTYWRRILSKYAAASRTEVVAKVVRLQAEAEVGHLTQVSEGLREVADHLLVVLRGQSQEVPDKDGKLVESAAILDTLPDMVVALDSEGFTTYANHAANGTGEVGEPFEWCLDAADREPFRQRFEKVMNHGERERFNLRLTHTNGTATTFEAAMCRREAGGAILSLRIVL